MRTVKAQRTPVTAAFSSLLGSCIEWYDFYIYGTATALVFNTIFFPSFDPMVGTLLAFGTFSAGAIMRPLGGIICGHFGDKVGRKSMLVWTLILMGGATVLIGLIPSYAQIGILAPTLLMVLRCVQGLAFGGEWAGAALIAVEHAPEKREGIFGCFPQMGSPIALFLSTGTFALLAFMPKDEFMSWGWRIPFVASAVLIVIGLIFRLKLLESPSFVEAAARGEIVAAPIKTVLKNDLKSILIGGGVVLCTTVAFYVQAIFVVSYATQTVGASRQDVLNAVLVGSFFELLMLPAFALLADRVGLKPVAFFGALWTAAFSFPFFKFIDAGTPFSIGLGITLAMVGISALFAVLPAYTSRLFDTRVRFTGISLSYGIAAGLIGGLTPLLASSLFLWAKSPWPIALYLVVISMISMIAVLVSPAFGNEVPARDATLDNTVVPGQASRN
ncbi:MHS family shikimate/dehydroshikimate transporter-like MFS transporter [Bradyrhizobium sp. USDA 4341]